MHHSSETMMIFCATCTHTHTHTHADTQTHINTHTHTQHNTTQHNTRAHTWMPSGQHNITRIHLPGSPSFPPLPPLPRPPPALPVTHANGLPPHVRLRPGEGKQPPLPEPAHGLHAPLRPVCSPFLPPTHWATAPRGSTRWRGGRHSPAGVHCPPPGGKHL